MTEVRVPRAIRQQMQAAEALEAQLKAAPQPNTVTPESLATPPASAPEQTPEARTDQAAPVAPQPPVQPNPAEPARDQGMDKVEHLMRTLRGMFNAEVKNLKTQVEGSNSELKAQVERLTQMLQSVESKPQAALDPKDVESFGADLVEMVRRQASAEITAVVQSQLSSVLQRLDQLERNVTGVSQNAALTAEQAFYASLAARKPNWKVTNDDPKFREWLGEIDVVYNEPRQAALDRAGAALDVDRVVAIFEAFEKTVARPAPTKADELQSQVAPTSSGAVEPPPSNAGPQIIRAQEVHRFYDDVRRGKFRGREAEAAQIEAAINKAMAEGRVL